MSEGIPPGASGGAAEEEEAGFASMARRRAALCALSDRPAYCPYDRLTPDIRLRAVALVR